MPEFPAEFLLAALVVTSLASGGLLGLWAATSRWHWFARTMVVLGLSMPLLWRPIFEPFVTLVAEVVTIAVGVMIYRRNWPRWRFSIAEVLMGMVVVSVVAEGWVSGWTRSYGPETSWIALAQVAGLGALAGVSLLLGAWLAVSERGWRTKLLVSIPCVIVLSVAEPFANYMFEWVSYFDTAGYFSLDTARGVIPGMIVVLPLMILGSTVLLSHQWFDRGAYGWRALAVGSTLLLVAYPAYIGWRLTRPLAIPAHVTTDSRSYVALRELIGQPKLLDVIREYNNDPLNPQSLAQSVDHAASEYEQLDQLLTGDLRIAEGYDLERKYGFAPLRATVRVLNARAIAARERKRPAEFVAASNAALRFVDGIEGQGLVLDWITHHTLEHLVLDEIHRGLELLDAGQAQELSLQIAIYNQGRVPFSDILNREQVFNENAAGWLGHLLSLLDLKVVMPYGMKAPTHDWLRKMSETEAALLATELAIRAYRRDHYGLPQKLADLVPKYLPEIPLDPWSASGESLRYQRDGQTYTLSVPVDGENVTLKGAFE